MVSISLPLRLSARRSALSVGRVAALMAPWARLTLWAALAGLTALLLLYPVQPRLAYYPVDSVQFFPQLALLGGIFVAWAAALVTLLLGAGRRGATWEAAALLSIFAVVFLSKWELAAPLGKGEEWHNVLPYLPYLEEKGHIAKEVLTFDQLSYFNFPGIHLFSFYLMETTGLGPLAVREVLMVAWAVVLALVVFALMRRLIGVPALAALAALLAIMANMSVARAWYFYPATLGLLLFLTAALVAVLGRGGPLATMSQRLAFLPVLGAVAVTHFVSAAATALMLVGLYAASRLRRRGLLAALSLGMVALGAVVVLTWSFYAAELIMDDVLSNSYVAFRELASRDLLWQLNIVSGNNVGERVPLWARGTRLFWWGAIYGLGMLTVVYYLARLRTLTTRPRKVLGLLVGLLLVSGLATTASIGGIQFTRFIYLGSFFTLPALVVMLVGLFRRAAVRPLAAVLALLALVLAFPTFLAHHHTVMSEALYPYEVEAARFLGAAYPNGNGLTVVSPVSNQVSLKSMWFRNATVYTEGDILGLRGYEEFRTKMEELVRRFQALGRQEEVALFLDTPQNQVTYRRHLGVELSDPIYTFMAQELESTNRVYDSGEVRLFAPVQE